MIAIYARQSVDKADSISIESQIECCQAAVFPDKNTKIYRDKGYSGGNLNRPGFSVMMHDVKSGKISKVVVYKLDRLSRSLLDFATIWHTFDQYHVAFLSRNENFDTSTPIGKAMLSITMVFAQLERETIMKRVRDNYYARGRKGMYLGGPAPYGFDKEVFRIDGIKTARLVPNENRKIIERLYALYEEGKSLRDISHILNAEGIPAKQGGNWDSLKISRLLHNPVYVKANTDVYEYFKRKGCAISNEISEFDGSRGCYLYGKRDRNAAKYTDFSEHVLSLSFHEGIISPEQWIDCQRRLDENKQIRNSGKGKYSWLSGLTKCGKCGYAMTVIVTGDGHKYFHCRGRTNYDRCDGSLSPVYVEEVEKVVRKAVLEKIRSMEEIQISEKAPDSPAKNRIKIELAENQKKIEGLVQKIPSADPSAMKYINSEIKKLDELKEEWIKKINVMEAQTDQKKMSFDNKSFCDLWDFLNMENKKEVVRKLIEKIYISDETIEIHWKF